MDIRTLRRQQLWSCSCCLMLASLQSQDVWAQALSCCLCKHLHQHRFSQTAASTADAVQGGGRSRQIKGWEEKRACAQKSTSMALTRHSSWFSVCTSAVGATPGFHPQTAAWGNTLIQVQNSFCLVLWFCVFLSRSRNLTIFLTYPRPLPSVCWLSTAEWNAKWNVIKYESNMGLALYSGCNALMIDI